MGPLEEVLIGLLTFGNLLLALKALNSIHREKRLYESLIKWLEACQTQLNEIKTTLKKIHDDLPML